jgi:hypothetical protein
MILIRFLRRPGVLTSGLFCLAAAGFNTVVFAADMQPEMKMDMSADQAQGSFHCGAMEYYNPPTMMCMPYAMPDMSASMAMVHGNAFLTGITEQGPRGRRDIAVPNWVMADIGRSAGDRHYFNIELMATVEKWTFPNQGYPELLQQGEEDADHNPFIDAQHPHSSPIMGLTASDTYWLGNGNDILKLSFAPRGESTDGPIAFMHRTTGMVNPDAPLGHHIGQDVGHITSTVLGAQLEKDSNIFEFSAFHGEEPQPELVDLPVAAIDSYAARYTRIFTTAQGSARWMAMGSFAYVKHPESGVEADLIPYVLRYSASVYTDLQLCPDLSFENTLIFGAITNYDQVNALYSVNEEFLFQRLKDRLWGRVEVLQRAPSQLDIEVTGLDPLQPKWVTAVTLGYTHTLLRWGSDLTTTEQALPTSMSDRLELAAGISGTKDFLPADYQPTYGGNPWTGKVFLQLGGMKMGMN